MTVIRRLLVAQQKISGTDTHTLTYGHRDWETESAQWANSVKTAWSV